MDVVTEFLYISIIVFGMVLGTNVRTQNNC